MIFCSSQFPFYCSPTCPLLVSSHAPVLFILGQGLEQLPFPSFLLESRLSKNTHIDLVGLGQWAGPGLGKGQAALSSAGCQSGCSPLPI